MPSDALTTAAAIADWLPLSILQGRRRHCAARESMGRRSRHAAATGGSVSVPGLVNDVVLVAESGNCGRTAERFREAATGSSPSGDRCARKISSHD
jgi:hypothetical protein